MKYGCFLQVFPWTQPSQSTRNALWIFKSSADAMALQSLQFFQTSQVDRWRHRCSHCFLSLFEGLTASRCVVFFSREVSGRRLQVPSAPSAKSQTYPKASHGSLYEIHEFPFLLVKSLLNPSIHPSVSHSLWNPRSQAMFDDLRCHRSADYEENHYVCFRFLSHGCSWWVGWCLGYHHSHHD